MAPSEFVRDHHLDLLAGPLDLLLQPGALTVVEDNDLDDVISEELTRGRRKGARKDATRVKERRRLRSELKALLDNNDKDGWAAAVRAFGYKEGTNEFRELMELWDDVS